MKQKTLASLVIDRSEKASFSGELLAELSDYLTELKLEKGLELSSRQESILVLEPIFHG